MPKIRRKKHELQTPEDEDVVVKVGKLRIYFQNYYTIISLVNDVLLGGLFLAGSIATLLNAAEWIRQWSYLIGSLFMLMRPILKILRNVFVYDKEEFQDKITDPDLLGNESKEKQVVVGSKDDDAETKSRKDKIDEIKKQENEKNK